MKCQILFPGENKKKHFKLSSTEKITQSTTIHDVRSQKQVCAQAEMKEKNSKFNRYYLYVTV